MDNKTIRIVVIGAIIVSIICGIGAIILFALDKPEAGAAMMVGIGTTGLAALAARIASNNGKGGNGSMNNLLVFLCLACVGCGGALCAVYDATNETSCALCESAPEEAHCSEPACLACAATSLECPFEKGLEPK